MHRPLLICLALLATGRPAWASADDAGRALVEAAPGRGFTVSTADGRSSTTLRPRLQLRESLNVVGGEASHEAQVRTVRLVLTGHALTPSLRYGLQLALGGNDFDGLRDGAVTGPTTYSPLFDAWIEYAGWRDLQIKAGQFFVPFDRARTVREFALQLVDRPQVVTELTLDRDMGISLSSNDLLGLGQLSYALFFGSGQGRNQFGGRPLGGLVTARLSWHPFGAFDEDQESDLTRDRRPRLAVAVAGGLNVNTRRQRGTTGATFQSGTTSHRHATADLVFKLAGLSLLAEGVWREASADTIATTVGGESAPEFTQSGHGLVVQLGYLFASNVELVGRYERLFAKSGTDPKFVAWVEDRGSAATVGTNLYLNGHALKLQGDYGYLYGKNFSAGRHLARLQLDASF